MVKKIQKASAVLDSQTLDNSYWKVVSQIECPNKYLTCPTENSEIINQSNNEFNNFAPAQQIMSLDMMYYLPDDILTKVDRAAMSVSLETRIPFLDHRVIEFASSLPLNLKINQGQSKWILRQILYKYVPQNLIERPKMGFSIPLSEWLRGPLKSWGEELLSSNKLKCDGFFDVSSVRKLWLEHISGKHDWSNQLWNILMFQAWKKYNE